ncbi:cysteine desulfurase [Weissella diestrammenae]|uniref:Cysteine desulfurase n=1 Tax=Weissella diestrammenae TaxID=1162633 RepID=A0A7G9T5S4_9LACO|nr:cysteine desulfurase [Weissella diestrammenae]MCM0582277.1 cysteine desulfurase [Weissella diestrammenae]QNN75449.1 cysteine desulfurase [Weissella diestrammenae]
MAFEKAVQVPGDSKTYRFNPELKRYALGDTGFVQNNAGAYVMQWALEPSKGLASAIKLKVVVNKELSGVKIKTINPSGNDTVNIFKLNQPEMIELYRFYLQELVQREILFEEGA